MVWPFVVCTIFLHWAIGIDDPKNDVMFKVNGQRKKPYLQYQPHEDRHQNKFEQPTKS